MVVHQCSGGFDLNIGVLVLIRAVLLLVAALPRGPHSRRRGCFPISMLGVVTIAVLVLVLMGKM